MDDECENQGPRTNMVDRRDKAIPFARRKELLQIAIGWAERINETVQPHERCLFRQFVQGLLERD